MVIELKESIIKSIIFNFINKNIIVNITNTICKAASTPYKYSEYTFDWVWVVYIAGGLV